MVNNYTEFLLEKNINDFLSENLNEGLIDIVRNKIGNKQVDNLLITYQKEMIDAENALLSLTYGEKIKNYLLKGGTKNIDQISKEIKDIDVEQMKKQVNDKINNLKKSITPADSQDGKDNMYVTGKDGKPIKITKRQAAYLNMKLNSINIAINNQMIKTLESSKKEGLNIDNYVKDLKTQVAEQTKKVKEIEASLKKTDEGNKKTGFEVDKYYIYTGKNGNKKIIKITNNDNGIIQADIVSKEFKPDDFKLDSIKIENGNNIKPLKDSIGNEVSYDEKSKKFIEVNTENKDNKQSQQQANPQNKQEQTNQQTDNSKDNQPPTETTQTK